MAQPCQSDAKVLEGSWGSCWWSVYVERLKKLVLLLGKDAATRRQVDLPTTAKASSLKAASFFHALCSCLVPEVQAIFKVGLTASNKRIKKIPLRKAQQLVFWFPLQAVKLTTKISSGNSPPGGMTYDLKGWSWIPTEARGWILQISGCHTWRDGSHSLCEFSCFHYKRIVKTLQAVKT